ncbi:MAG: hypothetical protein RSA99_02980 [Oscillospiraceae bacterium]
MNEIKRKTTTSTAVKDRWNAKNYKRFETRIKPDFHQEIEEYLVENSLSKSQFLKKAFENLKNK